jgi:hypothetical protein
MAAKGSLGPKRAAAARANAAKSTKVTGKNRLTFGSGKKVTVDTRAGKVGNRKIGSAKSKRLVRSMRNIAKSRGRAGIGGGRINKMMGTGVRVSRAGGSKG